MSPSRDRLLRDAERTPTAVSVAGVLVAGLAALDVAVAVRMLRASSESGASPLAPSIDQVAAAAGRLARSLAVGGAASDSRLADLGLVNGVGYLLMAAILAWLLVGFLRLRPWAWRGLMAWGGLALAVQLWRLAAGSPHYHVMLANALLVLTLNLEEVQAVFGLRRAG